MKYEFEKTGEAIERELLGVTRSKKERKILPREDFKDYFERIKQDKEFFKLDVAVADVKNLHSFSPTDPYPAFVSDIYKSVLDDLEKRHIIEENKFNNLEYYTAIAPENEKTPLDLLHGVDAFFELKYNNKLYLITVDLKTSYDYNPTEIKADIVYVVMADFMAPATYKNKIAFPQIKDLSEYQLERYTQEYEDLSKQIVDMCIKKIES